MSADVVIDVMVHCSIILYSVVPVMQEVPSAQVLKAAHHLNGTFAQQPCHRRKGKSTAFVGVCDVKLCAQRPLLLHSQHVPHPVQQPRKSDKALSQLWAGKRMAGHSRQGRAGGSQGGLPQRCSAELCVWPQRADAGTIPLTKLPA